MDVSSIDGKACGRGITIADSILEGNITHPGIQCKGLGTRYGFFEYRIPISSLGIDRCDRCIACHENGTVEGGIPSLGLHLGS